MASSSNIVEGKSTNRPPFFDGTDYAYWKKRMQIFLSTLDFEILNIIEDGYQTPVIEDEVTRERKLKPKREWTIEEKKPILSKW